MPSESQHFTERVASLQPRSVVDEASGDRTENHAREIAAASENKIKEPAPCPTDDWRRTERQGLFVVGSARSGTTILANCLNISRQVFLFQEADLFTRRDEPDFVAFFNGRHRSYGNFAAGATHDALQHKGVYVSPALYDEPRACKLLGRLAGDYAFVGEKIAIGARPHAWPDDWHSQCFQFYTQNFYRSAYFLTIRRPTEAACSMRKLWPSYEASSLLECWLLSLDFILDLYLALERTHVCFFDRFSATTVESIARSLGVDLELPPDMIRRSSIHTTLEQNETPEFLLPYATICQACEDLYRTLRRNFSWSSFKYCGATNYLRFFRGVKSSVADLLDQLQALADSPGADETNLALDDPDGSAQARAA